MAFFRFSSTGDIPRGVATGLVDDVAALALTPVGSGAVLHSDDVVVAHRPHSVEIRYGDVADGAHALVRHDEGADVVTIDADMTGQRTARYAAKDGAVHVSSHDIGLADVVPYAVDELSRLSLEVMGSSMGDASLIRGIGTARAGRRTTVAITTGAVDVVDLPEPSGGTVMEAAVAHLADRLPPGPVQAELSAGYDSRASLAATLACKSASDIHAFSEGPADSTDVVVAREIARRAGVPFERRETPGPPDVDVFLRAWTRAALENNGHYDIEVLASSWGGRRDVVVCGDGAEGFRSKFRGMPVPWRDAAMRTGSIRDVVRRTCPVPEPLTARFDEMLLPLLERAKRPANAVDRYYFAQRFAVWNQKLARSGGAERRPSPFYSRRAQSIFLNESPCEAGRHMELHRDLVRAHLPSALDLPVNGGATLSASGPGMLNELRYLSGEYRAKVVRRLDRRRRFGGADLMAARRAVVTGFIEAAAREDDVAAAVREERALGGIPAMRRFLALYEDAARRFGTPRRV